jgi:hypothetical protein
MSLTEVPPQQLKAILARAETLKQQRLDEDRRRDSFEFFSRYLQIRPKTGALAPLTLNAAQLKICRALEEQRAQTGRNRAIILKGRQIGCSTLIAAMNFHRMIHEPGLRTAIIAHERHASANLSEIIRRFYEHLPEDMKPPIATANAQSLLFDKLDSGFLIYVAGLEGAGRSATAQCLHASEVAQWPDLDAQMASVMQTVPDGAGTSIILESTAFGHNAFFELWQRSTAGETDFLPIFISWAMMPEYRRPVDADFKMTGEEARLADLHNLDAEQIAWRRAKIRELRGEEYFRQEYPLEPSEAFVSTGHDSFIKAELVLRARREKIEPYGALVVGIDPASLGPDGTGVAYRQGHRVLKTERYRGLTTMEIAGLVARIIREDKPSVVNIDVGGLGLGVYDRLLEQGHDRSQVHAVNFGSKPNEPPRLDEMGRPQGGGPANRRSELWMNMKTALEGRLQIPDDDALQADLVGPTYKYQSDGRLLLESKQDMRRRGVPSPDLGDAMALCFSDPIGTPDRSAGFWKKIEYAGGAYV